MSFHIKNGERNLSSRGGMGATLTILFMGAVMTMLAIPLGCSDDKPKSRPQQKAVQIVAVQEETMAGGLRYSANIKPKQQIDLAFKNGGYVAELLQIRGKDGQRRDIQEGDRIFRGQILATLRNRDYSLKEEQAKASFAEAQAALEQARMDYKRAEKLFSSGSMTKPDFENAKARLEMLTAKTAGARAILDEALLALQDASLRSPISGVVLKKNVERGSLAGPNSPAFVVADTSSVKAEFGVPDVLLNYIRIGKSYTLTSEAFPREEFHGRISRIAAAADAGSRVFDVEIAIPNPQDKLKTGMVMSLLVHDAKLPKPVAVIPLNAIVRPRGDPKAFAVFSIARQDGKLIARTKTVKLGEVVGNRMTVLEGLKAGDQIVGNGAALLQDGDEVRTVQ
ncbi:MAG TPA: efflux RND transporter periplasmic adaptor subunit [Syntrophales bacterium]|jgi:multidrug efflux system membrane fusion protein|nr:efflux RND transporter periplasmic adaptor subunit [Syntrophales bacterium]HON22284.1 efflux RND transporter periplasmic adaptor subunit [Syntrophales bacterium]HOU77960.1 efflux RND transporter periplasmic adaptor subunit [Syntrophales bacterium]HPC32901.1 efflux RND transporter periplasmic adaptor subunit [Syntrophales bacterium]HQG34158.1 efflux RND transporter periplasmic adaptor subunit [Syntrophales bacterium]